MFSRIFCRNTDVQERNEGNPVEPQVQGRQDSTTEPQSSGSKKLLMVWEAHNQNIKGLRCILKILMKDGPYLHG